MTNRSSDRSPNRSESTEIFTTNFQAIVTLSRLLGCHPHPIFSADSSRTTRIGKLWSIGWIVGWTTIFGLSLRDFLSSRRRFYSEIFGKVAVTLGFVLSSAISVIRAESYDSAIASVREFDGAAGRGKGRVVARNFGALGMLIVSWSIVGWIYSGEIADNRTDPTTLIYLLGVCVLSLEIYKYCFVLGALHGRFVQLRRIALSGKIEVKSISGLYHQPLTVQTLFILNRRLADAVGNFNRYYDVQIVYWLAYFTTGLIIDAYVLAHSSIESGIEPSQIVRLAFSLYHPALICIISHVTCKRANELGKLLFGYKAPSLATTVSSLERLEFGFWLFQQPLKITGLGLFYVDLPLLLSIIEASATYTTFILQNASGAAKNSANSIRAT